MSTAMQTLQVLEEQLRQISSQRQQYNRQVLEYENAITELKEQKDAYQIVGSVMVKKDAKTISQDLSKKKEIAQLRLKTLTEQEEQLQVRVKEVQEKVMQELDNK